MQWLIKVCTILDIANLWDAAARFDVDKQDYNSFINAICRKQKMNSISESCLYGLIFSSLKPAASQTVQKMGKQ